MHSGSNRDNHYVRDIRLVVLGVEYEGLIGIVLREGKDFNRR